MLHNISKNILETIGNTPLVKLNKIIPQHCADIYVKLEYFNPTGSYKDRMALAIVEEAEKRGDINPGGTFVEFTGGSTGTSLAFVCAVKGYKLKAVSSDAFAKEKLQSIKLFGADLDIIKSDGGKITPELFIQMQERVRQLVKEHGYYWTKQFYNTDAKIGYANLGKELIQQLNKQIDIFCAGVGTAGMLSGVSKELKKANIYPVKTRDFHNLYRIIRTILINNNTNYWFRSVLLSIHPELESLGTINTPELGARTRIPLKIKQEIEKRIGQFNNDELDLKPIKEGSGIKSTKFFEELKKMDIDIDQYLKQIKANAKKNKYDPKLIDWAYDDVHKLKYFSPEGVKKFGRVGYKDLLIYKQLEKLGKVEKGTAEKMKKRFHKSHEAISKKNKLSVYSPNELALNVLW